MKPKLNLKNINLVLLILFSLTGVTLSILHFISPEDFPKLPSYLATIFMPLLPFILKKLGLVFSDRLIFATILFAVIAMILGIDLDFYKNLYIFGSPCFDKIAHTLSGVISAFFAKEILDEFYTPFTKKYSRGFALLFIISFVALIAAGWECYEFFYDQIFGGHMQELITPGVSDTMWDIVGALGFGLVSAIPLSKNSTTKKPKNSGRY